MIIDRLAVGVGYDVGQLAAGEAAVKSSLARISALMKSPLGISLAVGTAVVGIGAASVDAAAKWHHSWAEVRTIMSGTAEEIAVMEKRVLDLANAVPQDQGQLAKGYYEVLSAGITDTADAYHVLEVASRTAVGGLSDTFTSVDAITTILNAYGMEASESTRISDVLFTTVREGKVTFPELAGAIGRVIPFAAAAKISLEDVGAAVATLTKGGLSMEIAGTAIRGVLMAILKPSQGAAEAAREMGLEFNSQALAAKGLVGFLQEVQEKTNGNAEAQARLFDDVRGLTAVLALAGKQSGEFARQQDIMINQAGGAANAAFEIMNNTLENQAQLLKNKLSRGWIELGNVLLGSVMKAITALNSISLDHTKQMESEASGVVKLRSEITRLDSTMIPLADRYDELSSKKIPLTTDETEELRKVTKLLAEAYPDLVSAVDKSGEALEFNTGALRRNRLELGRLLDKKGRESFKEIADEIDNITDRVGTARYTFEGLSRELQKQRGSPLVLSGGLAGGRNIYARSEVEERRDKALQFLQTWEAKVAGLTESLAGVAESIGVDAVVEEWLRLREAVNRTDEETKQMEKDEQILARAFGKDWLNYRVEVLERLRKSMKGVADETKKAVETEGEVGPSFKEMGGSTATDRAIDARLAAEKKAALELRAFIEENVGAAFFSQEQFDALGAVELAFFQNLLDERKKAEDDARTEREKAELDALKERQKIEIDLMLDLEEKRKKAATDRVSRYGKYARDTSYSGGPMLAGVPVNDPLAEVGPSLEAMGYKAEKAAAEIDPLNDGLQQLASRLGPQGLQGAFSSFFDKLKDGGGILSSIGDSLSVSMPQMAGNIVADILGSLFKTVSEPTMSEKIMATKDAVDSFAESLNDIPLSSLTKQAEDLGSVQDAWLKTLDGKTPWRGVYEAEQMLKKLGIDVPNEIRGNFDAMWKYLQSLIDQANQAIAEWGIFQNKTLDDVLAKWGFLIDAMDIEDPLQKWQKLVDLLKQSGDAGAESLGHFLDHIDPDKIEGAAGILAQIFAGGDITGENPLVQQLAQIMGMSTNEIVAYLKQIIESGGLTPSDLAAILAQLENIGDDIASGADTTAEDTVSVGRNVSLTEEQGRSLIGIGNTQILYLEKIADSTAVMDAMNEHLNQIYQVAQNIYERAQQVRRAEVDRRLVLSQPQVQVTVNVDPANPAAATATVVSSGALASARVTTASRTRSQGIVRATRRGL